MMRIKEKDSRRMGSIVAMPFPALPSPASLSDPRCCARFSSVFVCYCHGVVDFLPRPFFSSSRSLSNRKKEKPPRLAASALRRR